MTVSTACSINCGLGCSFQPSHRTQAGKKTEQLEEDIDDSIFDFLPFFTVEQVVLYGAKLRKGSRRYRLRQKNQWNSRAFAEALRACGFYLPWESSFLEWDVRYF